MAFRFLQREMLSLWSLEQLTSVVHSVLPKMAPETTDRVTPLSMLKPLGVRVADIGLTPRSLSHTIQPLYYVPADSRGHLADVVQREQRVQFWTALSL